MPPTSNFSNSVLSFSGLNGIQSVSGHSLVGDLLEVIWVTLSFYYLLHSLE